MPGQEGNACASFNVTPHPVQYYAPLYRTIARAQGVELVVLYAAAAGVTSYRDREFGKGFSWDVDLLGGYRSTTLRGWEIGKPGRQVGRGAHPEVATWMRRLKPDVAWVNGYTVPTRFWRLQLLSLPTSLFYSVTTRPSSGSDHTTENFSGDSPWLHFFAAVSAAMSARRIVDTTNTTVLRRATYDSCRTVSTTPSFAANMPGGNPSEAKCGE